MTQIGFIGLGRMGFPMAQNLIKAGHAVTGFDVDSAAAERLSTISGRFATAIDVACGGAEAVITMLPSGKEVREVYLDQLLFLLVWFPF